MIKYVILFLLLATIPLKTEVFAEQSLNLVPEELKPEKVIPNVPSVNRKGRKSTGNLKTYFNLPIIGDMLMNRPEDIRMNMLDPVKDKGLIKKHRVPIWPIPNKLRGDQKPSHFALSRNRLIEFYTREDGGEEKVYRVDLHFEPTHLPKMDNLMAHFRYLRYERGSARAKYSKSIFRTGKHLLTIHVRRFGTFTGREKDGLPSKVKTTAPFVMTMEFSPLEWFAISHRPSDDLLVSMRKGQILIGMYRHEVQAALAWRYATTWREERVRVHNGKDAYTVHFDGDTVKYLTR